MAQTTALVANSTLTYFAVPPGRAEATRLAFSIGGIPFVDKCVFFAEWRSSLKKVTRPWNVLPILTLSDGCTVVGQSRAILRLVGRCAGLYPDGKDRDSLLLACRCDELMDALDDLHVAAKGVGNDLLDDPEGRRAARAEAAAGGVIAEGLAKIDAFIATHGDGNGHSVGESLTVADLTVFSMTSLLCSGFVDGVPRDTLTRYKHIQACRKLVATTPEVVEYYDRRGEVELHRFEEFYKQAREI